MRVQFIQKGDSTLIVEYVDVEIPRENDHVVIRDMRGIKALETGRQIQAKVKEVVLDYTRNLALVTVAIN